MNIRSQPEIKLLKLSTITPNPKNPRKIEDDAFSGLRKSLERYGYVDLIIVNKRTNMIVSGHQRYKALLMEGVTEIACVLVDMDPDQADALMLNMNNPHITGEWTAAILPLIERLKASIGDQFIDTKLDALKKEVASLEVKPPIEEDEVPPAPKEAKTKLGQIFTLGTHRLMCGDSTHKESVNKLMDGNKADLLLTDPPYNVDYIGKTKDALKIKNDNKGGLLFRVFLRDTLLNADSNMREGACFYIWHADLEGYNFRAACVDIGWKVRQCLIWNKNVMVMGRQDYHCKHEPCLYGWKEGSGHTWSSDRKQVTVLNFDRPSRSEYHPTMKPINLFAYQICNNTKEEELCLDLFLGSGTTLIACEQIKRRCFGMELDPIYCDVIIARWEKLTGKKAELVQA